jgi:ABC-type Co2+ transport system permease subunit
MNSESYFTSDQFLSDSWPWGFVFWLIIFIPLALIGSRKLSKEKRREELFLAIVTAPFWQYIFAFLVLAGGGAALYWTISTFCKFIIYVVDGSSFLILKLIKNK